MGEDDISSEVLYRWLPDYLASHGPLYCLLDQLLVLNLFKFILQFENVLRCIVVDDQFVVLVSDRVEYPLDILALVVVDGLVTFQAHQKDEVAALAMHRLTDYVAVEHQGYLLRYVEA